MDNMIGNITPLGTILRKVSMLEGGDNNNHHGYVIKKENLTSGHKGEKVKNRKKLSLDVFGPHPDGEELPDIFPPKRMRSENFRRQFGHTINELKKNNRTTEASIKPKFKAELNVLAIPLDICMSDETLLSDKNSPDTEIKSLHRHSKHTDKRDKRRSHKHKRRDRSHDKSHRKDRHRHLSMEHHRDTEKHSSSPHSVHKDNVFEKSWLIKVSPQVENVSQKSICLNIVSEKSSKLHKESEKSSQFDKVSENSSGSDKVSEKSSRVDKASENSSRSDKVSEKSPRSDKVSEKSSRSDKKSEKSSQSYKVSEKSSRSDKVSKQSPRSDKVSEKSSQSDKESEKSYWSEKVSEQSSGSDKVSEKSSRQKKVSEKSLWLDKMSKTSSQLNKVSEKSSKLEKGSEKSSRLEKVSEKSSQLDKLSKNMSSLDKVSEKESQLDKFSGNLSHFDTVLERSSQSDYHKSSKSSSRSKDNGTHCDSSRSNRNIFDKYSHIYNSHKDSRDYGCKKEEKHLKSKSKDSDHRHKHKSKHKSSHDKKREHRRHSDGSSYKSSKHLHKSTSSEDKWKIDEKIKESISHGLDEETLKNNICKLYNKDHKIMMPRVCIEPLVFNGINMTVSTAKTDNSKIKTDKNPTCVHKPDIGTECSKQRTETGYSKEKYAKDKFSQKEKIETKTIKNNFHREKTGYKHNKEQDKQKSYNKVSGKKIYDKCDIKKAHKVHHQNKDSQEKMHSAHYCDKGYSRDRVEKPENLQNVVKKHGEADTDKQVYAKSHVEWINMSKTEQVEVSSEKESINKISLTNVCEIENENIVSIGDLENDSLVGCNNVTNHSQGGELKETNVDLNQSESSATMLQSGDLENDSCPCDQNVSVNATLSYYKQEEQTPNNNEALTYEQKTVKEKVNGESEEFFVVNNNIEIAEVEIDCNKQHTEETCSQMNLCLTEGLEERNSESFEVNHNEELANLNYEVTFDGEKSCFSYDQKNWDENDILRSNFETGQTNPVSSDVNSEIPNSNETGTGNYVYEEQRVYDGNTEDIQGVDSNRSQYDTQLDCDNEQIGDSEVQRACENLIGDSNKEMYINDVVYIAINNEEGVGDIQNSNLVLTDDSLITTYEISESSQNNETIVYREIEGSEQLEGTEVDTINVLQQSELTESGTFVENNGNSIHIIYQDVEANDHEETTVFTEKNNETSEVINSNEYYESDTIKDNIMNMSVIESNEENSHATYSETPNEDIPHEQRRETPSFNSTNSEEQTYDEVPENEILEHEHESVIISHEITNNSMVSCDPNAQNSYLVTNTEADRNNQVYLKENLDCEEEVLVIHCPGELSEVPESDNLQLQIDNVEGSVEWFGEIDNEATVIEKGYDNSAEETADDIQEKPHMTENDDCEDNKNNKCKIEIAHSNITDVHLEIDNCSLESVREGISGINCDNKTEVNDVPLTNSECVIELLQVNTDSNETKDTKVQNQSEDICESVNSDNINDCCDGANSATSDKNFDDIITRQTIPGDNDMDPPHLETFQVVDTNKDICKNTVTSVVDDSEKEKPIFTDCKQHSTNSDTAVVENSSSNVDIQNTMEDKGSVVATEKEEFCLSKEKYIDEDKFDFNNMKKDNVTESDENSGNDNMENTKMLINSQCSTTDFDVGFKSKTLKSNEIPDNTGINMVNFVETGNKKDASYENSSQNLEKSDEFQEVEIDMSTKSDNNLEIQVNEEITLPKSYICNDNISINDISKEKSVKQENLSENTTSVSNISSHSYQQDNQETQSQQCKEDLDSVSTQNVDSQNCDHDVERIDRKGKSFKQMDGLVYRNKTSFQEGEDSKEIKGLEVENESDSGIPTVAVVDSDQMETKILQCEVSTNDTKDTESKKSASAPHNEISPVLKKTKFEPNTIPGGNSRDSSKGKLTLPNEASNETISFDTNSNTTFKDNSEHETTNSPLCKKITSTYVNGNRVFKKVAVTYRNGNKIIKEARTTEIFENTVIDDIIDKNGDEILKESSTNNLQGETNKMELISKVEEDIDVYQDDKFVPIDKLQVLTEIENVGTSDFQDMTKTCFNFEKEDCSTANVDDSSEKFEKKGKHTLVPSCMKTGDNVDVCDSRQEEIDEEVAQISADKSQGCSMGNKQSDNKVTSKKAEGLNISRDKSADRIGNKPPVQIVTPTRRHVENASTAPTNVPSRIKINLKKTTEASREEPNDKSKLACFDNESGISSSSSMSAPYSCNNDAESVDICSGYYDFDDEASNPHGSLNDIINSADNIIEACAINANIIEAYHTVSIDSDENVNCVPQQSVYENEESQREQNDSDNKMSIDNNIAEASTKNTVRDKNTNEPEDIVVSNVKTNQVDMPNVLLSNSMVPEVGNADHNVGDNNNDEHSVVNEEEPVKVLNESNDEDRSQVGDRTDLNSKKEKMNEYNTLLGKLKTDYVRFQNIMKILLKEESKNQYDQGLILLKKKEAEALMENVNERIQKKLEMSKHQTEHDLLPEASTASRIMDTNLTHTGTINNILDAHKKIHSHPNSSNSEHIQDTIKQFDTIREKVQKNVEEHKVLSENSLMKSKVFDNKEKKQPNLPTRTAEQSTLTKQIQPAETFIHNSSKQQRFCSMGIPIPVDNPIEASAKKIMERNEHLNADAKWHEQNRNDTIPKYVISPNCMREAQDVVHKDSFSSKQLSVTEAKSQVHNHIIYNSAKRPRSEVNLTLNLEQHQQTSSKAENDYTNNLIQDKEIRKCLSADTILFSKHDRNSPESVKSLPSEISQESRKSNAAKSQPSITGGIPRYSSESRPQYLQGISVSNKPDIFTYTHPSNDLRKVQIDNIRKHMDLHPNQHYGRFIKEAVQTPHTQPVHTRTPSQSSEPKPSVYEFKSSQGTQLDSYVVGIINKSSKNTNQKPKNTLHADQNESIIRDFILGQALNDERKSTKEQHLNDYVQITHKMLHKQSNQNSIEKPKPPALKHDDKTAPSSSEETLMQQISAFTPYVSNDKLAKHVSPSLETHNSVKYTPPPSLICNTANIDHSAPNHISPQMAYHAEIARKRGIIEIVPEEPLPKVSKLSNYDNVHSKEDSQNHGKMMSRQYQTGSQDYNTLHSREQFNQKQKPPLMKVDELMFRANNMNLQVTHDPRVYENISPDPSHSFKRAQSNQSAFNTNLQNCESPNKLEEKTQLPIRSAHNALVMEPRRQPSEKTKCNLEQDKCDRQYCATHHKNMNKHDKEAIPPVLHRPFMQYQINKYESRQHNPKVPEKHEQTSPNSVKPKGQVSSAFSGNHVNNESNAIPKPFQFSGPQMYHPYLNAYNQRVQQTPVIPQPQIAPKSNRMPQPQPNQPASANQQFKSFHPHYKYRTIHPLQPPMSTQHSLHTPQQSLDQHKMQQMGLSVSQENVMQMRSVPVSTNSPSMTQAMDVQRQQFSASMKPQLSAPYLHPLQSRLLKLPHSQSTPSQHLENIPGLQTPQHMEIVPNMQRSHIKNIPGMQRSHFENVHGMQRSNLEVVPGMQRSNFENVPVMQRPQISNAPALQRSHKTNFLAMQRACGLENPPAMHRPPFMQNVPGIPRPMFARPPMMPYFNMQGPHSAMEGLGERQIRSHNTGKGSVMHSQGLKSAVGESPLSQCGSCGQSATMMCSGCGVAKYCSAECQVKTWPKHGQICKKINT